MARPAEPIAVLAPEFSTGRDVKKHQFRPNGSNASMAFLHPAPTFVL
jgi:hypothetical protein